MRYGIVLRPMVTRDVSPPSGGGAWGSGACLLMFVDAKLVDAMLGSAMRVSVVYPCAVAVLPRRGFLFVFFLVLIVLSSHISPPLRPFYRNVL